VSTVKLELISQPESVTLVRSVLAGVADLLGFDPELLHNLKAVVNEACNNVVLHAYDAEPGPLAVSLEIGQDEVEATVRDWGRGIRSVAPSEDRIHVGLAIISALADRVQFVHAADGGTEVRMAFTVCRGIRTVEPETATQPAVPVSLSGDAVASISPVGLLAGVLGRLATALAARARFSLDRFCDVYLVADVVAAHAGAAASSDSLSFAVAGRDRKLEIAVGPFPSGSGPELPQAAGFDQLSSALSMLGVDLALEPVGDAEIWRVVVADHP